jgi:hypothetical protein
MKKLFAFMMVASFAVAIVACGGKKAEETATAVDSVVVSVDSTAVVDSIATPVDSAAAVVTQ